MCSCNSMLCKRFVSLQLYTNMEKAILGFACNWSSMLSRNLTDENSNP